MTKVLKAVEALRKVAKHYTQMNSNEKNLLRMMINGKFRFTDHCLHRMKERRITKSEVEQAIADGEIIEFHFADDIHSRVLLRGKMINRDRVTCVVLDIKNNLVVTAYKNYYLNNHPNSDMSVYDETLNILEKVKISFNSGKTTT